MPRRSFAEEELINNPTTRVPVCLCLDTSGSMYGEPITELNRGVQLFIRQLLDDEIARYSAEVCTVTFDGHGAECIQEFGSLEKQVFPTMQAYGPSPMGEALTIALDRLEGRKQLYKKMGIDYFQPWLVIMTDGRPNGDPAVLERAISRAAELQGKKKMAIFPIGIGSEADFGVLKRISPGSTPMRLKGLNFSEFFLWLSRSVVMTSQSMPGESIKLENFSSWADI